jgi:hypothetical protein
MLNAQCSMPNAQWGEGPFGIEHSLGIEHWALSIGIGIGIEHWALSIVH